MWCIRQNQAMRQFRQWGIAILIGLLFLLTMMHFLQEKLIFLPTKLPQEFEYSFTENFEEIYLTAPDGAQLNAIHFKTVESKGLILYFHGNAGNLARWGEIASFFVEKDYDVIVMDYRTYGKSTGSLSEQNLYSDAQLFYDYAKKQYPEDEISVYGRSLGTAMATYLAANNKPKQLILETPFYNLTEMAKERFPILPVKALLSYSFNSNEHIQKVTAPITVFHGTDDTVVPYDSGRRLFDAIPHMNKTFITIDGGEHNDLVDYDAYLTGMETALQSNMSEDK